MIPSQTTLKWHQITAIPCLGILICGCIGSASSAVPPAEEFEWRQQALLEGERHANLPDVKATHSNSSGNIVQLDFKVVRTPEDQKATLAVVVPPGAFTSGTASLYRKSVFAPGEASSTTVSPSFEQLGFVRGYKIGRVTFSIPNSPPLDPIVSGSLNLEFVGETTNAAKSDTAWVERESTGPIREALEHLVANPLDLDRFLTQTPASVPGESASVWNPNSVSSPVRFKVPIDKEGLYQVTGADLVSSGVDIVKLRSADLRLTLEGKPQPLLRLPEGVSKESDNVTAETRWVFHGYQNSSLYTTTNTYWLVCDPSLPAVAMKKADQPLAAEAVERAQVFPESRTISQENPPVLTKNDQFLTILGFHWAWWTWTDGRGPVPEPTPLNKAREFTFDLPGLYVSGGNIKASAFFYPHSWPANQTPVTVRLRLNEGPPVDLRIENAMEEQKDFEVPASTLRESNNRAVLELIDTGSTASAGARHSLELCFERLQINYQRLYKPQDGVLRFRSPAVSAETVTTPTVRTLEYAFAGPTVPGTYVFDTTDSATQYLVPETSSEGFKLRVREKGIRNYRMVNPERIAHVQLHPFAGAEDLHSPNNSADCLVISHPMFLHEMDPWLKLKANQGHVVKVVNVEDIYDQFTAGQQTPHAIRSFIRYASANWKGSAHAPAATYVVFVGDSSSAFRDEFRNGVFNYVPSMTVGEGGDRFASDLWFATAFGDDILADNLLGRFSVNSLQDLRTVLAKQVNYAEHPGEGPWRNTLGFVADHSDFEQPVEKVMSETVPSRYFLHRILMSEQPWIDNYYFPLEVAEAKKSKVSPRTTAKIRDMFNAGVAMVTYFGHGSPNVWSNERIWFGGDSENSDNKMLTNQDKLAFIVNMTCNSGAIDYPMPRWNICISEDFMRIPNGGAVACYVPSGPGITAQHERFTLQLNRALLEEQVTPLGPALALANWRYLLHGNPPDLVRMFILVGDPALQLQFVPPLNKNLRLDEPVLGYEQQFDRSVHGFEASEVTTLSGTLSVRVSSELTSAAVLSVMRTDLAGSKLASGAAPIGDAPTLTLVRVQRRPEGLVKPRQPVQLAFTIKNPTSTPARAAQFELIAGSDAVGKSDPVDILPFQERVVVISVRPETALSNLKLHAQINQKSVAISQSEPLVLITEAPPERPSQALLVDESSLTTQYGQAPGGYTAVVSFRAYNASSQALNSVVAGLSRGQGEIVTSTPVSSLAPAVGTIVTLSTPIEITAPAQQFALRLTSGSLVFDQPSQVRVRLSPEDAPDLAIGPGEIHASTLSPTDGETVFFDVPISNLGQTRAESVRVEGYQGETSESQRLESRVTTVEPPFSMDGGTSKSVLFRWDPFHNAGPQHLTFRITSTSGAERNTENNSRTLDMKVRSKAKLRRGAITILPLTEEDKKVKQIRIAATIHNDGESDSQGIKVTYYGSPKQIPAELLGSEILPVLPANSSRDVVLTYKLKPGEETRSFQPSYEPVIKGSLQRVPLAPER